MKIKNIYILIGFMVFFGVVQPASACSGGNPCVTDTGSMSPNPPVGVTSTMTPFVYQPALPQTYGNSEGTTVYNQIQLGSAPSTVPPSPTRISAPDYSYISPVIVNQNGSTTKQLTETTSGGSSSDKNSEDSSRGSIFDGIFGSKKSVFSGGSSSDVSIDENLKATVNSKGLAMGGSNLSCNGKDADYIVLYKNITGQTLSNVAIRISLPDNVRPNETNPGSYSERDNTITIFIGSLTPNQEGQIIINGEYISTTSSGNVARSELVYTLPDQTQNMIVSYAFGAGRCESNNNALGASAIGGSNFFGGTLLGWIFLALFISALIYLIRFFLQKKEGGHGHHAH